MSETEGFTNTIDAVVRAAALNNQSKPEKARPTISTKEFILF